jgi:mannose-6-phosphate isomerase-like protein (cupin superfamily)
MAKWVQEDTYVEWQESTGVPVIHDFVFEDMRTMELGPTPWKGGHGVIINIPGQVLHNDCHVVELGPGASSEPEHHIYEETVYILSGRGATSVWNDEKKQQTFEWGEGSLFAIPLNAWYQHFNGSGTEPVRYLAVTTAPTAMRQYRNLDFVLNNPFAFTDRFSNEEGYFNGEGKLFQARIWETNFLPNADTMPLHQWKERGAGGTNVMLELAKNTTKSHISEFPVGTYKKAHRHGPGAHLVILGGNGGFSMLWQKGQEPRKCEWKRGSMVIVPTEGCFHQHFNTGSTRARYLALRLGGGIGGGPGTAAGADVSIKDGGAQVEYEDENPEVHKAFEAELARHGATCQMKGQISSCTGEVGEVLKGGD